MNFIGVDGCKKGWFAVALNSNQNWTIDVYKTFDALWKAVQPFSMMLIDIPIGLPHADRRICDVQARKLLARRGSSVFAVPCREALQAKNYRQACRINKRILGVKLSIQTWNICSKIKEIDIRLQVTREAQPKIRESHPELCFWSLAGKHIMAHSKKTPQGFAERFSILKKIQPQSDSIVKQALNQFRRKDLARDDILDGLVLAVSARLAAGKPQTVPMKPPIDKKGLTMEIVYPPAQFT